MVYYIHLKKRQYLRDGPEDTDAKLKEINWLDYCFSNPNRLTYYPHNDQSLCRISSSPGRSFL